MVTSKRSNKNDGGQGYINPPTYTIYDTQGTGCELKFTLDANGAITDVEIVSAGQNYTNNVSVY